MKRLVILPFLLIALVAGPAWAQSPGSGEESWDDIFARFELPPAQVYADSGIAMRRVVNQDAFRNVYPIITMSAQPGGEPMVEVVAVFGWIPGERRRVVLSGKLTEAAWRKALYQAAFLDRSLAPPAGPCLDGERYYVEAVDPGEDNLEAFVRGKRSGSCGDDLVSSYAAILQEIALAALPECARVHVAGSSISRSLSSCAFNEGDIVAAELATRGMLLEESPFATSRRVALKWAGGKTITDGEEANAFFAANRLRERFHLTRAIGESERRVRTEGVVIRCNETVGQEVEYAPAAQIWERPRGGGAFELVAMTVGGFAPRSNPNSSGTC